MVRIGRISAYFMFFILMLMYFTPKINAYYLLEKQLSDYALVLSNESFEDNGFSLDINNASLSFKKIDTANISSINVKIFALYNSVTIEDITLSSVAKSFIPLHVDNINIRYSILNPLNIVADGVGEFGEAEISFGILDGVLKINLKPSKIMNTKYLQVLKKFEKSENGEYIYEKNI